MGKTEAAKALAARPRHAAHAAAVLRGHRRRRGALRVELPAPAARHPAGRGRRPRRSTRRPVRPRLPRRAAAAGRPSSIPARGPAVLLIDEVDRADDEFEAFLFELLAESAVTIPELGTLRPPHPPVVVLTSNRTRDLHDALKRRCLYHWIDYPSLERAVAIIRRRVPDASITLAEQVAAAVHRLRIARRAEAAGHRRGHRLGGGARAARPRPRSTPAPPSRRSARCSSTAKTSTWPRGPAWVADDRPGVVATS